MTSKILITGITGQVGSIFADYLLQNTDLEIIGLMRWQESVTNIRHLIPRVNKGDRLRLLNGDLNDYPSLARIISDMRPTYISHLAAQSFPKTSFDSPIETLQTNILGTCNLLEAVRNELSPEYDPVVHVCSQAKCMDVPDPVSP